MKTTVLGAGAWGTALAWVLHQNDHEVTLWGHDPAHLEAMQSTRRNAPYLPDLALPDTWKYVRDPAAAARDAELVVMAVPSKAFRAVASTLGSTRATVVTATKGIEFESGLTMGGILESVLPGSRIAALSGPSLAPEVARGVPTAVVAASTDETTAQWVQSAFHRPTFRVYRSQDRVGVELGGALKNVIAIAAGVCDGLGFGDNSKAALITRGQAEVRRLGVASGARSETFAGLSGLGDLTVTCFSRLSRNRSLGEQLGLGQTLEQATASTSSIAEGVPTARAAWRLAMRLDIEVPIIREVHAMLFEGKSVPQMVRDLLHRDHKAED
ncbi:MAG: NAD(P)-dependent glycerol-3-phosphate dehydrogenase [Verrucomicrobiales bacterium]|nr:NAD(P)-dependent glycerol-3-phosphate dehydrogenase [Verrucomicrobiales bacterium]